MFISLGSIASVQQWDARNMRLKREEERERSGIASLFPFIFPLGNTGNPQRKLDVWDCHNSKYLMRQECLNVTSYEGRQYM